MTDNTIIYDIGNSRYINLTNACTLKCAFCPKFNGTWEVKGYELKLDHAPRSAEIIEKLGDISTVEEIVFCGYGESTLRLNELIQVAQWVKSQGGRTRINTDGLGNLANKRNILPEIKGCIDALSISLNAQNEAIYKKHCKPGLANSYQALLDFIELAPQYIDDVTITAIDGLEGVDIKACEAIASKLGVKFKRRVLDEVG